MTESDAQPAPIDSRSRPKKKAWLVPASLLFVIVMVGCGIGIFTALTDTSGTETLKFTDPATNLTFYYVISSDSQDALDLLDASAATGGNPVVSQRDTHTGTQECATTLSHASHTYSVVLYESGTVATNVIGWQQVQAQIPGLCATLKASSTENNSIVWVK